MRVNPRITASKLAEYMAATSFARKRAILQEQKYPQEVAMVRWSQAERPIAQYVGEGQSDLSIIDKNILKLQALQPDTEFKMQNRDLCVAALESFKLLSNQLTFAKVTPLVGPMQKSLPILVNGVLVSVIPQVILQGKTNKGTKVVGGIKFSFPKTYPLNDKSAAFLAVLIHWHCEKHLGHLGRPELRLCHAVDIPTSTVFEPPTTFKLRRRQLAEACDEIVQRWPQLPAPNSYDPES